MSCTNHTRPNGSCKTCWGALEIPTQACTPEELAHAKRLRTRKFRVARLRNRVLDHWWYRSLGGFCVEWVLRACGKEPHNRFRHPKALQAERLIEQLEMQEYLLSDYPRASRRLLKELETAMEKLHHLRDNDIQLD